MDRFSKQIRSKIMSKIKGENTKPELIVRSFLHSHGYRFRLHDKTIPGCPDIVLKKYNALVFVHGCFWHNHDVPICKISHTPKSNTAYWQDKIQKNVLRDEKNILVLTKMGWRVFIIWECECKQESHLQELSLKICGK
ncbi:DNA mismatch endonuclease Vsr [Legionella pneumophila serogroup 8]